MTDALALIRLLQLASPALPVGAYSYSQGLEWQVEQSTVRDEASAQEWIGDLLDLVMATGEAAVLAQLHDAVFNGDHERFADWNAWFVASRESSELRSETEQMGMSLLRILRDLDMLTAADHSWVEAAPSIGYPAAFALATNRSGIDQRNAVTAYLYAWLENQVLAAVKLVPLGQAAGQRLLYTLGSRIPRVVEQALDLAPEAITSFAPGLAIASSRHETQHTRLFRS
ncbi:MAG TPA: urease accessory protein UreF [Casimicrobiaceae bacterium]|nr:urease accessory protein UreF [Casimicrobiaceae bacterium]